MKTTAIMNLKGGTAKTVTAINMAAILQRLYEQRVLLVDADSQCNLTEFMTACLLPGTGATAGGLYDLLTGKPAQIRSTALEDVDILPATDNLMALDVNKAGTDEVDIMALADLHDQHEHEYDHMIIDCPPAFSATSVAALVAADQVIIPMKLDAFGIRGMANLLCQIDNMRRVNPELHVAGVLPTMYFRTEAQKTAEKLLRDSCEAAGVHVYRHIRSSTKVDEMTFAQTPLLFSSPRSSAARDYKGFVQELMGGEPGGI